MLGTRVYYLRSCDVYQSSICSSDDIVPSSLGIRPPAPKPAYGAVDESGIDSCQVPVAKTQFVQFAWDVVLYQNIALGHQLRRREISKRIKRLVEQGLYRTCTCACVLFGCASALMYHTGSDSQFMLLSYRLGFT